VRFDDDPETVAALDLYQWAIKCVRQRMFEPWPDGAPTPTRTPPPESPLHVGNEVFLTTVGWMLLHEFGHLAHNHPFLISALAKAEENEADLFATHHVLAGISDESIRFKRGVGIVVANVVLLLLGSDSGLVQEEWAREQQREQTTAEQIEAGAAAGSKDDRNNHREAHVRERKGRKRPIE
jgi:Peptidase U49